MFDPYHKWLGIEKDQRPVSFFQLLGISPKEKDPKIIQKAAARQADRLSPHQDGPQAKVCDRLREEIKKAKNTLLDPAKRKHYEALLRKKAAPVEEPEEDADDDEKSTTPWLWPVVGAGAAVLLIGCGLLAFWLSRPNTVESPPKGEPIALAPPSPPPLPVPPPPEKQDPPPPPAPPPAPPLAPVPPPPPPVVVPRPVEPPPMPVVVGKMPVPDEAAQKKAETELKETYRADYAKRKPEDLLALAAKLLQPGRENRKDPAAWFVLLREARDLATRADRPRLAIEANNEIDKWFLIDALDMKLKALTAIGKSTNDTALRSMAKIALAQIDQAFAADNYDVAMKLVDVAVAAAKKFKFLDQNQVDLNTRFKKEIQAVQKAYPAVVAARAKLRVMPDDADANLVVGKHLCFFQGKWAEGLALLAKGSSPELKELARKDLAPPADAKAQMAVANGWLAQANAEESRLAKNIQLRALDWYEQAEPKATPEDKVKLAERIRDLQARTTFRPHRLLPGSYFGRGVEDKVLLLREGGGTMRSEEAVELGLDWLVRHQAKEGNWSNHAFQVAGACNCSEPGQQFDIAGTAFGLLPFLAAGETHQKGNYVRTVKDGLAYLLAKQKPEGNFSDSMYENALATIAVCEAFGMTRDQRLHVPAQAAVTYIVRAQNPQGSWGYGPNQKGDTSVTGWQFSALKAGYYAKLTVPTAAFSKVGTYLDSVGDPNDLGYGYNTRGAARATSATGLLCREYLDWKPRHPGLAKGVEQLLLPRNFVTKEKPGIYFLFYTTQVMHHFGGKSWETWNPRVRDLLIELQDRGETSELLHQKGSWSPKGDDWAVQGGRLMYTSLALLTLEAYYCHVPLNGYGPAVLGE